VEDVNIRPAPLTEQAYVLHSFAESIRTRKAAETSGDDNLQSFAAVMAGVRSATQRRTVDVAELLERG
jgi:predicted dehydrogenase